MSRKTGSTYIPDDIEVIVVGNNYSTNKLDITLPDNIHYYKIYENLFYPRAIIYGVSKASGEIITFCDPDTFFFDDCYTPLYKTLLRDDNIGAVSSKLINPLTDRSRVV